MHFQRSKRICLSLIAVAFLGCGYSGPRTPPGESITLVILNNGQPVTQAHVDLSNSGGGGDLNEKGEAIIESVPPGEYRVVVYPILPDAAVIPSETQPSASTKAAPQSDEAIPRPFRDEATTPFKINVQGGKPNRIELDLKKP